MSVVKNVRVKTGVVVSSSMDKTIVVAVDRDVKHSLYKKTFKRTSKFYAQDSDNSCKEGDVVSISECAPISRTKRWKLVEKVSVA